MPAAGGVGAAPAGGSAAGGSAAGGVAAGGAAAGGSASGGEAAGGAGAGGATTVNCNTGELTTRLPCQLSETGLYQADMTTLAEGVHPFSPQFPLWTDGAEKKRWIWLPPDTKIDTTNMDYWSFPVGTKVWKEFSRDGVRVETRLLEKQKNTWYTVAYQWQEDQKDAIAVPDGQPNASGTEHDVPNSDQCWNCHSQQPDKVLGFSAVQLSHAARTTDPLEWTLSSLVADDLLTAPPAAAFEFSSGWPELEKKVFGYLHGNCGTCHNPEGSANSETGLDMWLKIADLSGTAQESSVYNNTVGQNIQKLDVPADFPLPQGATAADMLRFAPGSLDHSAIYVRFMNKGMAWTMPTLGSEVADPAGKELFEEFIASLQP
jgi:hypothetical protein